MSKQHPPAPPASAVGPCRTVIQIVGRPGTGKLPSTGSLPSTNAPPDEHQIFGVINQLGKFTPNLADNTKQLRDLLSHKNQFYWGHPKQKAFSQIKTDLTKLPILAL